jgi:hypothetical protein
MRYKYPRIALNIAYFALNVTVLAAAAAESVKSA